MIRFKAETFIHLSKEIGRVSSHLHAYDAEELRPDDIKKSDVVAVTSWAEMFDEIGLGSGPIKFG
jgi:hypothetical protein